eukprot:1391881-Amorphochlora_amoeboformis.AAC.2
MYQNMLQKENVHQKYTPKSTKKDMTTKQPTYSKSQPKARPPPIPNPNTTLILSRPSTCLMLSMRYCSTQYDPTPTSRARTTTHF